MPYCYCTWEEVLEFFEQIWIVCENLRDRIHYVRISHAALLKL